MGIRSRDLRSTQPNTTEQIIMKAAIFFLAAAALFASPVLAQTNFTSVAAAAAGTPTLSVLLQAVNASGLTSTLSNTSLVSTVFAPSDSAFQAYLTANNLTAAQLLASPALGNILKFHVVPGVAARAANLTDGQVVPTLLGPTLTLNLAGGNVTVRSSRATQGATVTTADVAAGQSIVHVINAVLIPPASGPAPAPGPGSLPTIG